MNFAACIAGTAGTWPDRIAVEHVGATATRTTTYAELTAHAERWASRLSDLGVARGDRVALLADNDEPWIAAYLGTLRLGAVVVPLDTAYRSAQVRAIAVHSGAVALCASARHLDTARAAVAESKTTLIELGVATSEARSAVMASVAPEDAAVMLYTSGTTADPKGVVLTHANLQAERDAALAVVDCHEGDVVLGVLPLFHALAHMANLLVPFSVGARVVFLETVSSTSLVAALQSRGITMFVCVPQFFYLIHERVMAEVARAGLARRRIFRVLLRTNGWLRDHLAWNPGRRWFARVHAVLGPSMRLLITGGSRFDPAIGRDLYDLGFTLLNGYGLTETSGAATVQRPADRYTASVGQALPGVEIRIVDNEVLIRGPILMREYFQRPDATAAAIRDGWLHTGDLGRLDADGRLYITGREKEIIVLSSGKNIYPEEVEAEYRQSPFIKELCVMGRARPDEPSAERLHALVVPDEEALRARGAVNVRELVRFELEERSVHLPPHKRVLSFDISMSPLPRTTTGKLRRHEIRGRVEDGADARPGAGSRPLTDREHEWLANPRHASAVAAVAAALHHPSVAPDANLELDLGLDSMERVELLTTLEQQAGVEIPTARRATIFTVRQLVEALEGRAASRTPEPKNAEPRTQNPEPAVWNSLLSSAADPALVRRLDQGGTLRGVVFFALAQFVRVFLRIRGTNRIPPTGPVIITPNHQSYLDSIVVTAALPFHAMRRVFYVGAAEYYQTRGSRWIARLLNVVPVDPDANLVAAMQASAAGLRSNHVLVIFPEGERSIDGEVRTFRRGAAILSATLGAPIVPVALDGLHALWPRGHRLRWARLLPWRSRISIAFGEPRVVPPSGDAAGTVALQAGVAQLLRDLRDNVGHR